MADQEKVPPTPPGKPNPPKAAEPAEVELVGEDSFVDFGSMASIDEGASGIIPLDQLPDPTSSPSVISWTQVIRQHQKQASFPEGDSVKIDSISDKDLIERVAREERSPFGKSPSDTDKLTADEVPLILEAEEDEASVKPSSSVELSSPRRAGTKAPSGSAVRFDVPEPPEDAGGVMRPYDFFEDEEIIELPPEAVLVEEDNLEEFVPAATSPSPPAEMRDDDSVGLGDLSEDSGPEHGDHSSILDMLLTDPGTPLSEVGFGGGQSGPLKPSPGPSKTSKAPVDPRTHSPIPHSTYPEMHLDAPSRATQPELLIDGEDSPLSLPIEEKSPAGSAITPGSEWLTANEEDDLGVPSFARRGEGNPEEAVDLYAEAPLDTGLSASGSFQVSQEQLDASERRARMIESSSIDLTSSSSLGSNFDVDLASGVDRGPDSGGNSGNALLSSLGEVELPEGHEDDGDVVDMTLPESEDPDQDSMLRHVADLNTRDEIDVEDELAWRRQQRTPAPLAEPEADFSEPVPEVEPEAAPRRRRSAAPANAETEAMPAPPRRGRKNVEAEEQAPTTTGRDHRDSPSGKKKGGGLLIGSLLGLLLGAGAFAGVWYAKLLPADPESLFGDSAENKPIPPGSTATPPPARDRPVVVAATPALGRQLLESGDAVKAIETFNQCDKTVPVFAGLGQAKWLAYVRQAAGKNEPLQRDDAQVAAAVADLDAAGSAYEKDPQKETELEAVRAALWRGLIEETLGDFEAAGKVYAKAAEDYKDHTAIFTTAQKRVDALRAGSKAVGRAIRPQEALWAFAILLQAPIGEPAAQPEAGFAFWDAVTAANKKDYEEAIKALAKAKETHRKQRDTMIGKGLNPFSDPREQIFERCCDDLIRYWTLCTQLYKNPEVQELVKSKGAEEALNAIIAAKTTADKALADLGEKLSLKKDQKVDEAVDALVKEKKASEELQKALSKQLADAGIDDPKLEEGLKKALTAKTDAETKSKAVAEAFDKAGVKEPDLAKAVAALATARDESEALVKTVKQKLAEAKYVEDAAGPKELLKGVDDAITRGSAEAVQTLGKQKQQVEAALAKTQADLTKTKEQVVAAMKETDVVRTKGQEELDTQKKQHETVMTTVKTPLQTLDIWLPALNDGTHNADSAAAIADAERVLNDVMAKDDAKAKATAVKAMALRNQNKIAEALETFASIRKHPGFKDQPWTKEIVAAEDQLRNPAIVLVHIPPTTQQILQMLETKMKVFSAEAHPKENAKLLAHRSMMKLEAQDIEGAAADAESALKADGGAEAFLAVAKVAERQRKWDEAEKNYRAAIKLETPGSALWRQAKQGVIRVLLDRALPPADAAPTPMKEGMSLHLQPESAAFLLATMFFAPEVPLEINEALKQGDDLIAQKEYLGYILKAKAYALVGKYQEAMRDYSTGIKLLKVLPREYEGILDLVIRSHPALQGMVEENDGPSGEKFYSAGLDAFQSANYAKAEEQFLSAIRQNKGDARFLYYLGLSRWLQGKEKPAEDDFRAGALLELKGLPSMRTIGDSLERVQGPARLAVNRFRP